MNDGVSAVGGPGATTVNPWYDKVLGDSHKVVTGKGSDSQSRDGVEAGGGVRGEVTDEGWERNSLTEMSCFFISR